MVSVAELVPVVGFAVARPSVPNVVPMPIVYVVTVLPDSIKTLGDTA